MPRAAQISRPPAVATLTAPRLALTLCSSSPLVVHLCLAFRHQGGKRKIDFDDLKRIAGQIGEPIEDGELHEMITEADHSGTGAVGQEDFIKIVTSYAHHYDGEK